MKARLAGVAAALVVTLALSTTTAPASAWIEHNEFPLTVEYMDSPQGIAFDREGLLHVVSNLGNSVTAYRVDPVTADLTAVKTLEGPNTGLIRPRTVAFDQSNRMYVVSSVGLTVYAKDWAAGDTAPIRQVDISESGLVEPAAVAFDSADRMYIVNSFDYRAGTGSVTVYRESWVEGDPAPLATLIGPRTGLDYPNGIGFDRFGFMYISNRQSITAYPNGWLGGDVAPVATLRGPATRLSRPMGIAFDDDGFMVVANRSGFPTGSIEFFPPDWARGNTGRPTAETPAILANGIPPTASITGLGSLLDAPYGVALAADGRIFASNQREQTVSAYHPQLQVVRVTAPSSAFLSARYVNYSMETRSGLPISVMIATPKVCRLVEERPGVVELLDVGQCIIEGSQYGDDDWARAPVSKHPITVMASPQTIAWSLPSSLPLALKAVELSGRASSGLPVYWISATPAVCDAVGPFGQRLKLLEPGTCVVTGNQAGNAHWQVAPAAAQSTQVVVPRAQVTGVIRASCRGVQEAESLRLTCHGAAPMESPGTKLTTYVQSAGSGAWSIASVSSPATVRGDGTFTWSTTVNNVHAVRVRFATGGVLSRTLTVRAG